MDTILPTRRARSRWATGWPANSAGPGISVEELARRRSSPALRTKHQGRPSSFWPRNATDYEAAISSRWKPISCRSRRKPGWRLRLRGRIIRKGAPDAIARQVKSLEGAFRRRWSRKSSPWLSGALRCRVRGRPSAAWSTGHRQGGLKALALSRHGIYDMITGDNPLTAATIAAEAGWTFPGRGGAGDEAETIRKSKPRESSYELGTGPAMRRHPGGRGDCHEHRPRAAREASSMEDLDSNRRSFWKSSVGKSS